jgi:hypothetical protein
MVMPTATPRTGRWMCGVRAVGRDAGQYAARHSTTSSLAAGRAALGKGRGFSLACLHLWGGGGPHAGTRRGSGRGRARQHARGAGGGARIGVRGRKGPPEWENLVFSGGGVKVLAFPPALGILARTFGDTGQVFIIMINDNNK